MVNADDSVENVFKNILIELKKRKKYIVLYNEFTSSKN